MLIHLEGMMSGRDFQLHHIQYNSIQILFVVILAMVVLVVVGEEENSTNRASNSFPFHLLVVAEVAEEGPITSLKNIMRF